jgi:tetratricopeptide (TPR) repeat protein
VLRQMALGAASKLRGKLAGAEEQALATPPAQSLEAFDFYLQGAYAMHGSDKTSGDAALTYFNKAVEIDSTLADAFIGIGAVNDARYFNGGPGGLASLKTAETNFKHALRLKPDSPSAIRGMIKVYWENGQSEEGLKLAKQAAKSGRETVDDLLVRADAYFLGGIPDKAVPLYRRVLDIDPANDGALWSLVLVLAWSGQFRETLQAGDDYFRRFGEDPEVHTWVAFAHHGLGEMEEARKHYETAIQQLGENPTWYIYWYIASLYRQTGHPDKARDILSQGIQLGRRRLDAYPDNVRLRALVGSLYGYLGDRETFQRYESRLEAEAPDNGLVWGFMAQGQILLGESDRGVALLLRGMRSGCYQWLWVPRLMQLSGCGAVKGTPAYENLVREFEATQNRLRSTY